LARILFSENQPARALYLRHGFVPVGILHEQGQPDGVGRDTEMMECLLEPDPATR
jgi:L-amino acid N-acyltransferase YncA